MVVEGFQEGQTAVLCSSGLDSVVLLAHEMQRHAVHPIYVAVGLAWENAERAALGSILMDPLFSRIPAPIHLELPMSDIYAPTHWAIVGTPPGYDTPDEDVYLAGRNITLLVKAAVYSALNGISRLVIAPLAGNPFPDATREFLDTMAAALSLGLATPLHIEAPFAHMKKSAVVRLGAELGVPLELTLSCMNPKGASHCGACSKCRERQHAFREAGVEDRTVYAAPAGRG
jgi:7-cyano-7-deazaguanine synthase